MSGTEEYRALAERLDEWAAKFDVAYPAWEPSLVSTLREASAAIPALLDAAREVDRLREWMERGGVALPADESPVDAVIKESRLYFALSEANRADSAALRAQLADIEARGAASRTVSMRPPVVPGRLQMGYSEGYADAVDYLLGAALPVPAVDGGAS